MQADQPIAAIAEEERQRADLYVLLARLLSRAPDEAILDTVRKLKGDEGPIGESINALAAVARAKTAGAVDDEFHDLFIGLDQGEVVPYASHYLTGRLYEAPLAKLRIDMAARGIGWDPSIKEPEDHIAALCEMMAGLILGAFGEGPASIDEQRSFYEAHLAPWGSDFFSDLAEAESATFYMPLARLGSHLMALEDQAFRLAV